MGVVALVSVLAAVPASSSRVATSPEVLFSDKFKDGFDLTNKWQLLSTDGFTANDGVVTTSSAGLHVQSPGTNPLTGEPAFTVERTDDLDHVKWSAVTQHESSNRSPFGFFWPGFDAVPGQELSCTMQARGRTFGTAAQPFGNAVTDPQSDLRLASFAMNTLDLETGMVFDFVMTNTKIYPYYERLDIFGDATYHAFSSYFAGVPRSLNEVDTVTVAYDRAAGIVRWIVNDQVAATVTEIGIPSPSATRFIDHGGTPERAAPRQLNCGMAQFTFMDGGIPPNGPGLVQLDTTDPYVFPTSFVGGSTIFGQGAEMDVHKYEIRATNR